jgi:glycerol-3-phosphate acyltransferase PlsY
MDATMSFLSALAGYLLGSISFSRLIARLVSPHTDLKHFGYRDEEHAVFVERLPTATTVSMALGWKAGCAASILDMIKVFLPTLALRWFFPGQYYFLLGALFGLIGNNWPIYYRFKGGSGLSAIYGGLLAVDPLGIIVTVVGGFFMGMLVLRSMILTFLLPLLLLIPWFWFRTHDLVYGMYALAVVLLYVATLIPDVRKYLKARETAPVSERAVMESMPMGRGMLKMLDMLKLAKK